MAQVRSTQATNERGKTGIYICMDRGDEFGEIFINVSTAYLTDLGMISIHTGQL